MRTLSRKNNLKSHILQHIKYIHVHIFPLSECRAKEEILILFLLNNRKMLFTNIALFPY